MDDKSIIRLLHKTPEPGIDEAILKYEPLLTAIATRILHRRQDVEECVSDAFVELWKHIDSLDPEKGSLKGYLICTVRNRAINYYRKSKRGQVVTNIDDLMLIASDEDLENTVLLQEDTDTLLGLIDNLEEPEREIMLRKFFLFESISDIASFTGLQSDQVKYKLKKTKCSLRKALTIKGVAI